jgi:hypothetical protein
VGGHLPILDLPGADDPWRPPSTRRETAGLPGRPGHGALHRHASHALVPEQPAAIAEAIAEAIAAWAAQRFSAP